MNKQPIIEAATELRHIIGEWQPRLLGIPHATRRAKASPERWSIKEIVGHLINSAANNHQRFVRLHYEPSLSFPLYSDHNDDWVLLQAYQDEDWDALVQLWASYNLHLAHVMEHVDESTLSHRWQQGDCTLAHLLTDYVDHLKLHLDEIAGLCGI